VDRGRRAAVYTETVSHDLHLQAARHRAEVLAAALKAAETAAPARLPASIAALAESGDPVPALEAIEEAGLAEEALDWVRAHRRADAALRAKLEPLAAKAKARRASRIHLESDRVLARARYAKEKASLLFGTPELQTLFSEVLRLEGLPLELDLGKRPRPLVSCAPPLPFNITGECEWLEVQLRRGVVDEPDLLERLNRRLPDGLRLLDWDEQPAWVSPVAELCETAQWRWPSDEPDAHARVSTFLAAETFFLDKVGKVEGQKQDKRLDLRPLVSGMGWEDDTLRFTTALRAAPALNPLKLLGAILGRAPGSIMGLRRTGFGMTEDARLQKGDRYTAKLKNMYEDAVLLGAASNITIVDEDDDEPLELG
jgi:radical SAM-linked protein